MEGLLYEPRSLWSIANVIVPDEQPTPMRVQLNRQHFTNRTRWPMTLNRVAISGINYTWDQGFNPFTGSPSNPAFQFQAADVVQRVSLSISAPQRYHMNSKSVVNSATCTPRPTWDPPDAGVRLGLNDNPWSAGLHNVSQLAFDYPLYIPRTAAVEWQISAYTPVVFGDLDSFPDAEAPTTPTAVNVSMLYQEEGGMFFGSGRQHRFTPRVWLPSSSLVYSPLANTEERWPYPPDAISGFPYVLPTIPDWWDPRGLFSAKSFKDQDATRDGSTKITDMRAAIDQFIYDIEVSQAFDSVFADARTTQRVAPMSTRMGTRVRTVDCGSRAWWWRPGAPLCLVFDAKTPALVYELNEQITLMPGDTLDVEMTFPNTLFEKSDTAIPFHVGVSFNGYSPIEG